MAEQLAQLAARAAITDHAEVQYNASTGLAIGPARDRLMDEYHDLLNSVLSLLEAEGVQLPDPTSPETARAAWL